MPVVDVAIHTETRGPRPVQAPLTARRPSPTSPDSTPSHPRRHPGPRARRGPGPRPHRACPAPDGRRTSVSCRSMTGSIRRLLASYTSVYRKPGRWPCSDGRYPGRAGHARPRPPSPPEGLVPDRYHGSGKQFTSSSFPGPVRRHTRELHRVPLAHLLLATHYLDSFLRDSSVPVRPSRSAGELEAEDQDVMWAYCLW